MRNLGQPKFCDICARFAGTIWINNNYVCEKCVSFVNVLSNVDEKLK
jgi:hypothetical protein